MKPYVENSPLLKRLWCRLAHGKRNLAWYRGPMGWVDWQKCEVCGAIHDVG